MDVNIIFQYTAYPIKAFIHCKLQRNSVCVLYISFSV